MPKTTRMQRRQARRMYEEDGESQSSIARYFNVSPQTVMNWKKKEGWVKAGTVPEVEEPEAMTVGEIGTPLMPSDVVEPATAPAQQSDAVLRARVAELEAKNAQLAADNERLKPTRDVTMMIEDRVQWLTDHTPEGDKYWINRAEAAYKQTNRERAKDGLPVFDIKDNPEILEDLIIELKTKEEMAKNKPITEPASRKVKLYIERNGMPTIEQIPMESQINNMAGSLADGIIRYTRKGFKLTDPFLCPRAGCFRPAANDELGNWAWDGYCSDRHRLEVEGDEASPTAGLQTKDTILSGIR